MFSKKTGLSLISLFLLSFCGSLSAGNDAEVEPVKFRRLFCWGCLYNEDEAKRFAGAGVTDILVTNRKQYDLAVKYGMTPYWRVFTPAGPHPQVMTPEETQYGDYIGGKDLPAGKYIFVCKAKGDDWGNVTVKTEGGSGKLVIWEVVSAPAEGEEPETIFITLDEGDELKSGVPFTLTIMSGAIFK